MIPPEARRMPKANRELSFRVCPRRSRGQARNLLFLSLLLAALALPALAESTRFWRQASYADFDKGTARGVALRSDGELLLAPRYTVLADPDLEFLWAVAEDRQGNLYVGGGGPARVVQVSPDGRTRVVFESKELEVHALVADPRTGTLYLATSPDGALYELPAAAGGGDARKLFEPGAKYLWDLVRASDGTLYLATGDKGEIFRVAPDGKGELFFSSGETHVRSLALDSKGNLYAGTEPNGLVLRLSPRAEAFVVYETARREVTALSFDSAGNLYVAAIGQKLRGPGLLPGLPGAAPQQPPVQQPATPGTITVTAAAPAGVAPAARLPFMAAGGSDVYRIAPDGSPQLVWSSPTELVYSLSFDSQNRVLVGTGNDGKLLALDSPTLFTNLVKSSSQQVTSLLRSASGPPAQAGRVYLATANPGKLAVLGPELEAEGSFESDVFDAQLFSQWGRISWQSRNHLTPANVQLFTRSGNTSDPQKNWSPWSEAYADAQGTPIASPAARFAQWKAVLRATDSRTPSLSAVSVAYLRRNVAPAVDKVIVQAPGIGVRGLPAGAQQPEPVQLELPQPLGPASRGGPQPPQGQPRVEPPPQGLADPSARSVLWSASDENDDTLVYSVHYRGEEETRWKLMKDNLRDRFYTWDAAALPDGAYYVKVVASDALSNPADRALTGENVSDRFEVDNTPPRIDQLSAQPRSRSLEAGFLARDTYSPLKKAEYSLNAGEWMPLFPAEGPTDAREHRFSFRLENLDPGEHTLVVRVYDQFNNPGLAKITFTVK
jgi:sugar lactone lactonase YvrE